MPRGSSPRRPATRPRTRRPRKSGRWSTGTETVTFCPARHLRAWQIAPTRARSAARGGGASAGSPKEEDSVVLPLDRLAVALPDDATIEELRKGLGGDLLRPGDA